MDGQILANSLVGLKGTELRMIYALLKKTNIGHLLLSKTKDLISKEEQDHFTKHLEEEVNKLEHRLDEELQVNLLLHIAELLQLKVSHLTLEKEVMELCNEVVKATYELYKKEDKKFRQFSLTQTNSCLQQMIIYQMNQVFDVFNVTFENSSEQDQLAFVEKINEYVKQLPIEKQNQLKDKLGIEDLTDEVLKRTIQVSSASVVFAIIVEVSGFAFYTTATSLVATLAGLVGVTVPFGIYTGLTSTIAIISSPIFIIPLLLGGGGWLIHYQNNNFKKKLLPITVMQIALPFMTVESSTVSFDLFTTEWKRRYEVLKELQLKRKEILIEKASLKADKDKQSEKLKKIETKLSKAIQQSIILRSKLREDIKKPANLRLKVSEKYINLSTSYQNLIKPYEENPANGFWTNVWNIMKMPSHIKETAEKTIREMAEEVLKNKPTIFMEAAININSIELDIQRLSEEKKELQQIVKILDSKWSNILKHERENLSYITNLQERNYGFGELKF